MTSNNEHGHKPRNFTGGKERKQKQMHYKKRKGIIRQRMRVYCPEAGEEREFSFDPTGFCPVCRKRLNW